MGKKYFTAFCNMNSTDLRANLFYHSCLVFLEADCDENQEIILPMRAVDAYGFYGHPIPSKKSFFEEPFTFLCQQVGINFRLRGSFGEWKRENIHDLSYGRGLTGRLFEMNSEQFNAILDKVNITIEIKNNFFSHTNSLLEQETLYQHYIQCKITELTNSGILYEDVEKKARSEKYLPEFKFSVTGNGNTCKIAALDMIASVYDEDQTSVLEYINHLKGIQPTDVIPRLTYDLDTIILHAITEHWESRGTEHKYPYCDWAHAKQDSHFSMIAVTFGGKYLDSLGDFQRIFSPDKYTNDVIDSLKTISRLCELNILSHDFREWHQKVCHYLFNLASSKNTHQLKLRTENAEKYITALISSTSFQYAIQNEIPSNLTDRYNQLLGRYDKNREEDSVRLC